VLPGGAEYSYVIKDPDIDDFRPDNTHGSETVAPNYRRYLRDRNERGAEYADALRALGGYRAAPKWNP